MRALFPLLVAIGVLSAGCGGGEGRRAQELLQESQAAAAKVKSASYELELAFSAAGQDVVIDLEGSGYVRGRRAGDQVMTMRGSGPLAALDFELALIGKRAYYRLNGRWQTVPGTYGGDSQTPQLGPEVLATLSRYVKDVNVQEGQIVNGESVATIAGVIDAKGLLEAVAGLEQFSEVVGQSAPDLSDAAERISDITAVLAVSERTHLLRTAVIDLSIDNEDGEEIAVQVVYRLRNVNKPVRLPKLG